MDLPRPFVGRHRAEEELGYPKLFLSVFGKGATCLSLWLPFILCFNSELSGELVVMFYDRENLVF